MFVSLIANVTCPVLTLATASSISAILSSNETSGLYITHADNPWGIVFVGITITLTSPSKIVAVCWAVITILELFGKIITFLAFTSLTAATISSVDGFIVCPPLTT